MKKIRNVIMLICAAMILPVSCGGGGGGGGGGAPVCEEIAASDFSAFLAAKPDNTAAAAYKIKITDLTASDLGSIKNALMANGSKYVDLSATSLPSGVTNILRCFSGCTSLVQAPAIPAGVTVMTQCFQDCTSLVQAPAIPEGDTYMYCCFAGCTSLVQAVIPAGVTFMHGCFFNCTALKTVEIKTTSCTDFDAWETCFEGCIAIEKITVPNQDVKDRILAANSNITASQIVIQP